MLETKTKIRYNIPSKLLNEVAHFAKMHGIQRIILFGSRGRGDNAERSDIDIAVSGGDADSFYWKIKEKSHTLLTFDIVELDRGISDELQKEIDRDGIIIYEKGR